MADEQAPQEECFIVGVIGKAGSEQRIHADWFFEGIVRPTFEAHYPNFKVLRADHMKMPGIITSQIIEKLLNARLVIADLTFLNPNVFYEIGIRHMTEKPMIHVHQVGESIPFDISTFLSMEYSLVQHSDMVAARESLRVLIGNVLTDGHKMENPVTQTQGRAQFEVSATPPDRVLLSHIEALSARLSDIERREQSVAMFTDWAVQAAGVKRRAGAPVVARNPNTGRFYGGGEALPINELTFSLRPETNPRTLEFFITENVQHFTSDSLKITRSANGESFTVHYASGALDPELIDRWAKEADTMGLDLIPF